ncbi:DUF3793 family protein [Anaeromicropila populeti]|uniref:DUF3793 family protein n=1 Tax=Anaeromicropila populeti TaxID=37658 RepID=A0A1I6K6S4_9FIRM|nr:DUF3793 family protein [Anaeromicropila populeti]SFR86768.1 Protein of unknown function [Anaeromicropila populeti]
MPTEHVMTYLSNTTELNRVQFQIALQSAPLLKGIREACICTIPDKCSEEVINLLEDTGISYRCIYHKREKCTLYLYREELLERHLERADIQEILIVYGYKGLLMEDMIEQLSGRLHRYYMKENDFPHEIGAFLGYPGEDIKGFIENGGKNCILTGYWKVYQNLKRAKEIFEAFDRAKEEVVDELLNGKSIREIACA